MLLELIAGKRPMSRDKTAEPGSLSIDSLYTSCRMPEVTPQQSQSRQPHMNSLIFLTFLMGTPWRPSKRNI